MTERSLEQSAGDAGVPAFLRVQIGPHVLRARQRVIRDVALSFRAATDYDATLHRRGWILRACGPQNDNRSIRRFLACHSDRSEASPRS